MEFPKDPKPTPEEMVETYVQTCAMGLNISVEEAKKKIYACSTTTYQGFQAVMTEAESEQFQNLPGVVFILPDSYIDPVNKEYGGDTYINGTIIPRPPPVQYNRGRNDRNRPRYGNQRGSPGNFSNQQGPMQGDGRNFGPPRNVSQQNYGQPGQVPPPSPPPGRFSPGDRGSNFNQSGQGNYYPQERRGPPTGDQRGFGPSVRGEFGDTWNYAPQGGFQNFGPGPNQNFGPGAGGGFSSGARGGLGPNQGFGPGTGGGYGSVGRSEQGPGQGFRPV
uniref:MORF/ORRM1/DAG-like MORF domain-containing protein n=1 Tax=Kalanchoe fedtschenkoi TaxID=63787 RepID=A0A7N1A2C0_KALFE